jgi:hypothetical protein
MTSSKNIPHSVRDQGLQQRRIQAHIIFPFALMIVPIAVFYALVTRELINVPFLDDYGAILGFVDTWRQIHGIGGKLMYILTAQHNEYKIMFSHAVFVVQYLLFGHVNFVVLSLFGNLFILGIFAILYKMWTQDAKLASQPLLLFAPVAWILFQLQYYSLVSWPMTTIQNAAIIFFVLLSIYLLSKGDSRSYIGALAALIMSIASSGNGVFLVPIGMLMLIQQRKIGRLVSWVVAAALMVALYLYKYNFHASQSHPDTSVTSSAQHVSIVYMLAFLGSSIARYQVTIPVVILGICFCALLVALIYDKAYLTSPASFYSVCFILLTALAVSGLRSDFGVEQSLASRYRIYSNLMVIFSYFYIVRRWLSLVQPVWGRKIAVAILFTAAIGFNIVSTRAGFKLLLTRKQGTIEGIRRWEHGETPITYADEGPGEDPVIRRQRLNGNFAPQDAFLKEAIADGTYTPPQY